MYSLYIYYFEITEKIFFSYHYNFYFSYREFDHVLYEVQIESIIISSG